MELDKNSEYFDALANLYRAALYLGRGLPAASVKFLSKANENLADKLNLELLTILKNPDCLKEEKDQLYWAEKILDNYQLLKQGNR